MNDKLSPCPFCGGEAELKFGLGFYIDAKHDIFCYLRGKSESWGFGTPEMAIKHWNTRKPMERIVEQLENHKNCYEKVIGQVIVDNYDINLERADLMNHAIDIVRKGGVDNAE